MLREISPPAPITSHMSGTMCHVAYHMSCVTYLNKKKCFLFFCTKKWSFLLEGLQSTVLPRQDFFSSSEFKYIIVGASQLDFYYCKVGEQLFCVHLN